jgi:hypothetical protein
MGHVPAYATASLAFVPTALLSTGRTVTGFLINLAFGVSLAY